MIWQLVAAILMADPPPPGPPPPSTMAPLPPRVRPPPPPTVQPRVVDPGLIVAPDWVNKPNGVDLVRYYPAKALAAHVDGKTTMICLVEVDGTLSNCRIVHEDPPDMGFGVETLRLASKFRMRPLTVDGRPVRGAKVLIPINWSVQ